MDNTDLLAYLKLLRDLSGSLDQLGDLAEQKAQTVREDDLLAMDEVIKQEQVLSLSLRGLEQRRTKLLAKLGWSKVPLSGLAEQYPPELQDEAAQTVKELRRSYRAYRSRADMARTMLELNLHQIDKLVKAAGGDPKDMEAGYAPPGVEPPKNMKTDFRA